jgi:hypothetical protein
LDYEPHTQHETIREIYPSDYHEKDGRKSTYQWQDKASEPLRRFCDLLNLSSSFTLASPDRARFGRRKPKPGASGSALGAEREQRSSPLLTKQLRELVRRYDWPWKVALLHDDFRDGDYTYDPSWIVSNGDFRVVRGSGLRTVFDTTRQGRRLVDKRNENPAMDIFEGIFGARDREARSDLQTTSQSGAEIYTRLSITKAFAVKVQLKFRGNSDDDNRLEFGPYLNNERHLGYRLAYESGNRPSLSLLRIAPGRSAIIETYDRGLDLEDGNPHIIEWRRADDGEMVVLLDDKEIIRTIDRAHSDSFNGFNIVNKGGVYELKEISIFGTH